MSIDERIEYCAWSLIAILSVLMCTAVCWTEGWISGGWRFLIYILGGVCWGIMCVFAYYVLKV